MHRVHCTVLHCREVACRRAVQREVEDKWRRIAGFTGEIGAMWDKYEQARRRNQVGAGQQRVAFELCDAM